mmetsp:Transcript_8956/g.16829  ORF Transcript_8956/g.16829 Transcript_8956/m.16829 type:complete len:678 (+) Transcript_8956:257-2290(+)
MENGCRVKIPHLDTEGYVRYMGPVHYAKGEWIGVELDNPVGKNNGTVKGKSYFECPEKCGVFAKARDVVPMREKRTDLSNEELATLAVTMKKAGNDMFASKRYRDAVGCYSDAIDADPENHILYGNRAACYLELEEGKDALEDANEAIRLKQDWWKGHARRGKALSLLGRLGDASEAFDIAAKLTTVPKERKDLLRLKAGCLEKPASKHREVAPAGDPAWMNELPPNMREEARSNPVLMEMMRREMEGGGQEQWGFPESSGMDPRMFDQFASEGGSEEELMAAFANSMGMDPASLPEGMLPNFMGNQAAMMGGFPGGGEQKTPGSRLKKPVLVVHGLHEAVKEGDVENFKQVLAEELKEPGFDINLLDDHTRSALAWACSGGKTEIARELILNGAQVNPVTAPKEEDAEDDNDAAIPLFLAVKAGSLDTVALLLEHGADLDIHEPILGHTVLHQAVKSGNMDMVKYLLNNNSRRGSFANAEDFRGISALGLACNVKLPSENARLELFQLMFDTGAVVDPGCLLAAIKKDDPVLLKFLADREPIYTKIDSQPPLKSVESGMTMLHIACRRNDVEALKMLVSKGMKTCINEPDNSGATALGYSCRKGGNKAIGFLVKNGADVNIVQDKLGNTPLHIVGDESNEEAWKILLSRGAKETARNHEGKPPKLRPNLGDKCVIM